MIAAHGAGQTESWAKGVANSLARPPRGGDTDQITGVASGECQIALANTYYYGRLMDKQPNLPIGIFFADQQGKGSRNASSLP